jgi:hypothetical protein
MSDHEDNGGDVQPPLVPPPPPPTPPCTAGAMTLKVTPFWADAPVAWFASVETQFMLKRITSEVDRFCITAGALDKDTTKKVVHLINNPDPVAPFTALKAALLASHHLTDYQKVELLLAMDSLGGRKPSELLADMIEMCPAGQESNVIFVGLFLQRLPREIRVLLSHDDHSNLRVLAAKADKMMAYGGRQAHDVVAAVEYEDVVAAIRPRPPQKGRFNNPPPAVPPRPVNFQAQAAAGPPAPSKLARQSTGLCFYHWSYGEKAKSCKPPCTWQPSGN